MRRCGTAPRQTGGAHPPLPGDHELAIATGAATRRYPGETANGDVWTVHWHAGLCRITLVDGLGHGPEAAHAAQTALTVVPACPDLAPDDAIRSGGRVTRRPRRA
ncbi:MAG: hypothetical protein AVDCRST_MAG77-1104 [uncultured Chloroflexi bacterium]|uniref:PPM-type phosphatase domain-containing protein n=1 Tax=uncultured Chloroflexota bacterium TaxID=166587 RepID=A0A6J4HSX8_9CHLR|nr:MAG: hypothetical protein AVDCRST_MAG77-1104 [uncultured Chloroflexota bacterium]